MAVESLQCLLRLSQGDALTRAAAWSPLTRVMTEFRWQLPTQELWNSCPSSLAVFPMPRAGKAARIHTVLCNIARHSCAVLKIYFLQNRNHSHTNFIQIFEFYMSFLALAFLHLYFAMSGLKHLSLLSRSCGMVFIRDHFPLICLSLLQLDFKITPPLRFGFSKPKDKSWPSPCYWT